MAKPTTICLPKGIARYPSLSRPDTKYNENGVYKANVAVPLEDAEATMAKLQSIAKQELGKALPKSDNPFWKMEIDDNGDETGMVMFKASVKNVVRRDGQLWDRKPKQYDADLNMVDEVIYGGSELIVSCEIYVWEYSGKKGVSLQPTAVQIIKLVGPSEDENPFEKQDGGYVGTPSVPSFATDTAPAETIEEVDDF